MEEARHHSSEGMMTRPGQGEPFEGGSATKVEAVTLRGLSEP